MHTVYELEARLVVACLIFPKNPKENLLCNVTE